MQRLKVLRSSIKRIERSKPTSYKKRKFHLNVLANEHDADVESENFFEEEETNEVSQLKLQLVDAGEQIQITQQALGVARHESKEQVWKFACQLQAIFLIRTMFIRTLRLKNAHFLRTLQLFY